MCRYPFLLLDLHVGVEKEAAHKSAGVVLAVSIPLTLIFWGFTVINRQLSELIMGQGLIIQRATAVIMAIYSVLMTAVLLIVRPNTFEAWQGVFASGLIKFLPFFFVSLFLSCLIGVRDIWMDYVSRPVCV